MGFSPGRTDRNYPSTGYTTPVNSSDTVHNLFPTASSNPFARGCTTTGDPLNS